MWPVRGQQSVEVCRVLVVLAVTLGLSDSRWVSDITASVEENVQGVYVYNGTYEEDSSNCQEPTITISPTATFTVTEPVQDLTALQPTWTVRVFLTKPLDAETESLVQFNLTAYTTCGGTPQTPQTLRVRLIVDNVLDSAPRFLQDTYVVYVNESTPAGTLILHGIEAEDDDEFDLFNYTVNFSPADRLLFNYTETDGVIDIYLRDTLDFETTRSHSFTITATDSINLSGTCEVVINVRNMLDTRPVFSLPVYFASVQENVPVGTSVTRVSAFDGDAADGEQGNVVRYSILQGGAGLFHVDPISGEVTTARQVDAESSSIEDGQMNLVIMAQEEISAGLANQGATNTTVTLHVQVLDLDDNVPEFNAATFTGSIWEQASVGDFITLANPNYISVQDKDNGASHNRFTIHLERDGAAWDVFTSSVETGQGFISLLLQLAREGELAHWAGTEITFQIIARPLSAQGPGARSMLPSVADVTLSVARTQIPPQASSTGDESFSTAETVIIVLVIALIVFIIVATIYYVVRKIRRDKAPTMPVFRRNSKYYVSKRDISDSGGHLPGSEPNATRGEEGTETEGEGVVQSRQCEEGVTQTSPTDVYEPYVSQRIRDGLAGRPTSTDRSVLESSSQADTLDSTDKHTVTAAVNRNRCDLTLLANKTHSLGQPKEQILSDQAHVEIVSPTPGSTVAERAEAQTRSQDTLLSLLDKPDNSDRCDVTSLTEVRLTAPPQTSEDGQAKTNTTGYVNLIQLALPAEVTAKPSCDVTPLDQTLQATNQEPSELQNKINQKLVTEKNGNISIRLSNNCDVVPFSHTRKKTDGITQIDTVSSASDLMQSESRKSSFSNTSTTDVAPLIKESGKTKELSKNAKPQVHKETKPKIQGMINPAFTDHNRPSCATTEKHSNSSKRSNPAEVTASSKMTKNPVSPLVPKRVVTGSQLSQPGVPPVALALPSFTGPHALAEEYTVITNPVYEPYTNTPTKSTPTLTEDPHCQHMSKQPEHLEGTSDLFNKSPSTDYMTKAKSLLSEVASSMLVNGKSNVRPDTGVAKSVRIVETKDNTSAPDSREKFTMF